MSLRSVRYLPKAGVLHHIATRGVGSKPAVMVSIFGLSVQSIPTRMAIPLNDTSPRMRGISRILGSVVLADDKGLAERIRPINSRAVRPSHKAASEAGGSSC